MMTACSPEMIDYAADLGMNWVVVCTSGHKTVYRPKEDPPVYMKGYKALYAIRRTMSKAIEAERDRCRRLMDHAKRRGLKVIYHTYEVSVPAGFEKAYPRMFSLPIREFRSRATAEQQLKNLCVSRIDVREALAAKVRELCEVFPQIDGFSYTHNESATQTQVWHRCELCRDIPFAAMMKHMHDAVRAGLSAAGRPLKLFARCWGGHETDFRYWQGYKLRAEWGGAEVAGKDWLPAYVDSFRPAHLHFVPSRDIPQFIKLLRGQDTAFLYKASWGDNNLHHPLNPWIGRYAGHEQVCEISFEHAYYPPRVFYIMGREMQKRARLCRDRGAAGLCTVPVSWGCHDSNADRVHPSRCSLVELNLYLLAALSADPDADLEKVCLRYLRRRYGGALPAGRELAAMLLNSEDVAAEAMNIHGIRSTDNGEKIPGDFHGLLGSFARYGPMYKDWRKRLDPTPRNLAQIFRAKDAAVARAQAMLARIEGLQSRLPERAYREFHECFSCLRTMARSFQASHKVFLTMFAIRQGRLKPTTAVLDGLHEHVKKYADILPANR